MKFGQRHSIRKNLKPIEFAKGLWSPEFVEWRDVIEDYLSISQKRINNKLSMYKLQINILMDIVNNIKALDQNKSLAKIVQINYEKSELTKTEFEAQMEHINSQLYLYKMVNKALKEIADGIVWKYFEYNRAILYLLAERQPIDTIRPDRGTLNNIKEFAEIFSKSDSFAIFNDITNFLRVGDITRIDSDGNIELVEVKSKREKGARVRRQKEEMTEIVEFLNAEEGYYHGNNTKIIYTDLKHKYHLKTLNDAIHRAKDRGYESLLIGSYLIAEIIDFEKIKDSSQAIHFFESRHNSIKRNWQENDDFVFQSYFLDKMDYSKNCAPFSIYPFDIKVRVGLITGSLMVLTYFNFSNIIRLLAKAGWETVDSIIFKTEKEIRALHGKEISTVPLLRVKKGPCTLDVPADLIARMKYEFLSVSSVIERLDEIFNRGPKENSVASITHSLKERKVWK
ncbi:MAG: hypothetical protein WC836_12875 [Desulfobacula sp.]|jgi:hypothetical protein